MNPYWGVSFFEFFYLFFSRVPEWIHGRLAHDEIQVFSLIFLSVSCSILGCFLVYRKMSMMVNSLSHTVLIGIVSVFLLYKLIFRVHLYVFDLSLYWLLIAAIITSVITYFFTSFLHERLQVQEDASIGLVFT
ncbi:MAG: metal ABC transporter permease, partial [Chlamydiales bacterium]|nr:metal ABC transporter permease [Chlamydiales bacterium]